MDLVVSILCYLLFFAGNMLLVAFIWNLFTKSFGSQIMVLISSIIGFLSSIAMLFQKVSIGEIRMYNIGLLILFALCIVFGILLMLLENTAKNKKKQK